jgi:hypothetical protein
MPKRKRRYYRMIIQRPGYVAWGTETMREYVSTKKGDAPDGWVCVATIASWETTQN